MQAAITQLNRFWQVQIQQCANWLLSRASSRSDVEIVAAGVVAAVATAAFTALAYIGFPHLPFVVEFTSGNAVWSDANKLRDVTVVPMILVFFVSLLLGLILAPLNLEGLGHRLARLGSLRRLKVETLDALCVAGVTAVLAAHGWIDLYLTAAILWHLTYRHRFLTRHRQPASSLEIVVVVLAVDMYSRIAGVVLPFGVQALIVSALIEEIFLRLPPSLLTRARRWVAVVTYATAAWWFLEFLPFWRVPPGMFASSWPPLLVSVVVAALALALLGDGMRRAAFGKNDQHLYGIPIAIALGLCLRFQLPAGLVLSADDYHYGEIIQPLWQALTFGHRLFVDVVPTHGLSDLVGAAFARFLFGNVTGTNTIIGDVYAGVIILGLSGLVTAVWLPPVVVVFALFFVQQQQFLVFVIPYMAFVLAMTQSPQFSRLLPLYVLASFIMSFALAGPGTAAVAASLVPVGIRAALELRHRPSPLFIGAAVAVGLAVVLVVAFFTPLRHHLVYLLTSSKTNLTIYGVPWRVSFVSEWPNLSLELRRYSWLLLIMLLPLAAALTWTTSKSGEAKLKVTAALAYILVFMLLNDAWADGRIDAGGISRPGMTAMILWPVFAICGLLAFTTEASRRMALCLAVIMLSGLAAIPNFRAQLHTKPFERPPEPPLISEHLPAMGRGGASREDIARASIVKEVLDSLLAPDETFLNVTNRTALYVYVGRPSPIPIASVYNAAPNRFQEAAIDLLNANMPPVALLSAANMLHDGGPLSIRANAIYRFVIQNYEPFFYKGLWFGIRKNLRSRLNSLHRPGLEFTASRLTDENWVNGIARPRLSAAWSFFVDDKAIFAALSVGTTLRFADGSVRKIEALQWPNIKVSGPALDPVAVGRPHPIVVADEKPMPPPDAMAIYDQLFGPTDLASLPSAWGRSYRLLKGQLLKRTALESPVTTHVVALGDGWYRPTGSNPFVVFDAPRLRGSEQGILGFDFRCHHPEATGPVRLGVYWHSPGTEFSEERAMSFAANSGFQIVPMDSRASWLAGDVGRLRIDLRQVEACERFHLGAVALFSRRDLRALQ